VDDDHEDMADIVDENENTHGRFHTEVHDQNNGSFVQSEEDDGVEVLPEE